MGQIGEVGVAGELPALVEHAPAEKRRGQASLHKPGGAAQVGGSGLRIDGELAALEAQQPFRPAHHAEDVIHIEAQLPKAQQRHQFQRGRAGAGEEEFDALELVYVAHGLCPILGADIGRPAGGASQHHAPILVVVFHARIAQEIGKLGRGGARQQGQPIGLGDLGEEIGAGGGAATRAVLDHDGGLARQMARQQRRIEPRPKIHPAPRGEGHHQRDGLAREISGGGAETRERDAQGEKACNDETTHDGAIPET